MLREPGSGTRSGFEHALEGLAFRSTTSASRWSCRPMKQSALRWKRGWAPRPLPRQSPRRVSKPGSFDSPASRFRNAATTRCATPNDTEAEQRRRLWTSLGGATFGRDDIARQRLGRVSLCLERPLHGAFRPLIASTLKVSFGSTCPICPAPSYDRYLRTEDGRSRREAVATSPP